MRVNSQLGLKSNSTNGYSTKNPRCLGSVSKNNNALNFEARCFAKNGLTVVGETIDSLSSEEIIKLAKDVRFRNDWEIEEACRYEGAFFEGLSHAWNVVKAYKRYNKIITAARESSRKGEALPSNPKWTIKILEENHWIPNGPLPYGP